MDDCKTAYGWSYHLWNSEELSVTEVKYDFLEMYQTQVQRNNQTLSDRRAKSYCRNSSSGCRYSVDSYCGSVK